MRISREFEDKYLEEIYTKITESGLLPDGVFIDRSIRGSIYVSDFGISYAMRFSYFDGDNGSSEVRFTVRDENQLSVGWGGNNLLTTNLDENNDRQIFQLTFISSIFKFESAWRKILTSVDMSEAIEENERKEKEAENAARKLKEDYLAAYNKANLKVGSQIRLQSPDISLGVERISKNKVQLGHLVYTKEEIGSKLLSKEWEVL